MNSLYLIYNNNTFYIFLQIYVGFMNEIHKNIKFQSIGKVEHVKYFKIQNFYEPRDL